MKRVITQETRELRKLDFGMKCMQIQNRPDGNDFGHFHYSIEVTRGNSSHHTHYSCGSAWQDNQGKPIPPQLSDVIYSLFSDSADCYDDFEEFCDSYGYDNDSIKAMSVYNAVVAQNKLLEKSGLFDGIREKIAEILEEY